MSILSKNINNFSKYSSLGIYRGQGTSNFRKISASSLVVTLKVAEFYALGYLLALLIQKSAKDFQYTKDLLNKFPEINKFINSPNFIYYFATAFTLAAVSIFLIATIVKHKRNSSDNPKDLAFSIQKAHVKTSPSLLTIIAGFTLTEHFGNLMNFIGQFMGKGYLAFKNFLSGSTNHNNQADQQRDGNAPNRGNVQEGVNAGAATPSTPESQQHPNHGQEGDNTPPTSSGPETSPPVTSVSNNGEVPNPNLGDPSNNNAFPPPSNSPVS